MTDLSLTTLVPEGQALKNSPIKTKSVDVRLDCLFCRWTRTIRFDAKHVAMLANGHFALRREERLCKKR